MSLMKFFNKLGPKTFRCLMNCWGPFIGCGIHITEISPDFKKIQAKMTLRWYNRNYIGTHFGGGLFAMCDGFHLIILLRQLKSDYIVWDKAGQITFKKPGRGIVRATFEFTAEEIASIKSEADTNDKYLFDKTVDIYDESGDVIATAVKTLYVKRKTEKA